jgi:zona occludens toxin
MAIELITGLPGASKTLTTIERVIDIAAKSNRPVFYSGIKELAVDDPRLKGTVWTEFDPKLWHEVVPSGAIIFIDEVQTIFRARAITSNPPPYVTELEQHRHKGIDFYVTTQHPRLIDPALKVLTANHRHLVRIFGGESSTIHYWDGIKEKPESTGAKNESQKTVKFFPKELYGLYKSADLHTSKFKIPKRVWMLAALPLLLGACAYVTYKMLHKVNPASQVEEAKKDAKTSPAASGGVVGQPTAAPVARASADPIGDLKDYVWKGTPRVVGLPQTAPKYDQLTVPTRVPIPAMCIQRGSVRNASEITCKCWSQQATPMDVPFNMCIEFARNGFFRDFDADKDQQQVARADRSQDVLSNRPDSAPLAHQVQDGPRVSIIPGQSMGPQRTEKAPGLNESGSTIQDGPPNNRATRAAGGSSSST